MIGWHTHRPDVIRFVPNSVGMSYNTALLFLVCGIGMISAAFVKSLITRICAIFTAITSLAIIVEYLFRINLGIDELIVRDFLTRPLNNPTPGRMAVISTITFVFIAVAMFLISFPETFKRKSCWIGAIGSLIFSAGVSIFTGYVFTSLSTLGWGVLTRMAMTSAVGFLILGAAFIVYAWLA